MINPSLIESKFLRAKNTGDFNFTKTWKQTDSEVKRIILQDVNFDQTEVPIINYYRDELHWWLMSNNVLYIKRGTVSNYEFKEIEKADIPLLWKGEVAKMQVTGIQIFYKGDQIDLFVEPLSWPIVFTLINFVAGK